MPIRDWLIGLNVPTTNADTYARDFETAGITNEQDLPRLGLTREDLKELRVSVGHRQPILDAIRVIDRDIRRTPSATAEARHDLIRRMFPVALSVGFAARLVDMPWVKGGQAFDYAQGEELARLLTAIFIVVSGWEWYHRDVRRRPLETPWRFIIDVMVVITTIVFLFSAKNQTIWLASLLVIFLLYILWDALSIYDYPADYDVGRPVHPGRIIAVYWRGFWNGPRRGPTTTAVWFLYFAAIAAASWLHFGGAPHQMFIACFFLFLGAVLLRLDGNYESGTPPVSSWRTQYRLLAIIGLMGLYWAASRFLPQYL
jgi:hypothetical protein